MPKLFQINTTCNRGSTGHIAEMLGLVSADHGYDCYMAYGRFFQPSKMPVFRVGNTVTHGIHLLGTRLFDAHGLFSLIPTRHLINIVDRINPDIIHLHNIHGYYINYRLLFSFLSTINTPIVWTFHDCWPITGHCSHFDYLNCTKWKQSCYECPGLSVYPKSLFWDHSAVNYRLKQQSFTSVIDKLTIVTVSNWLEGIVRQSFLRDAHITTINNGIDTKVFDIQTERHAMLPPDKKIVLCVASAWNDRKGYSDILKLSSILDDLYSIVVVGLTKDQLRSLPRRIIGFSRTESVKELALLYSSADVFINPTWEDSLSMTNIESQACGTPVITYRTGGTVETVLPETGIVVDKGNVLALKEAIETICSVGKHNYSAACRQHVLQCFKDSDRYSEYVRLYDRLIKDSKGQY